jgi:hypothetical protein
VLSRYYESNNWDESQDAPQYVNMDAWLDPEEEDLPWVWFKEAQAMCKSSGEPHTCP